MLWTAEMWLLAKVGIAGLCGGLIGLERELNGKPAGLRTQMLVSAASCLFVGLGTVVVAQFDEQPAPDAVRTDPIRLMEAIITGVSFIGAGTVIFHKGESKVEGLTTAAAILLAAGIGMAVGLEQYLLAGLLTVFTLVVLVPLGLIERRLPQSRGDSQDNTSGKT